MSFEESINRLEEIANELEKDNLSLDESTKKFEEGMEISKKCAKKNYFVIIINEEKHRQVCRQDNWLK